jgi:hypothetical protein
MKRLSHFFKLLLLVALSACQMTSPEAKSTYTAHTAAVSSYDEQVYTFDYPASWLVTEGDEVSVIVSQPALQDRPPKTFGAGQVLVLIRILQYDDPPASILADYVAQHRDGFTFADAIGYQLNGRSAVRVEGTRIATEEQSLTVAVDLGEGIRAIVGARLAPGELSVWQETILAIASSLQLVDGTAQ